MVKNNLTIYLINDLVFSYKPGPARFFSLNNLNI